jgi:DNA repair protein RecO (recombination protein O)
VDRPRLSKTEAIVLKQLPMGEADRILTLFTPDWGKVRALSRGVRRPRSRLAGHLEPLVYTRVMLARGRNLAVVAGAETLRGFSLLRGDLEGTARALVCAELVDAFCPEEQAHPAVFALLLEALDWLEAGEGDRFLRYFELNLLQHLGYMPELHRCVTCQAPVLPDQHAFSPRLGGVVCFSCVGRGLHGGPPGGAPGPVSPLSLNGLKVLRHLQSHSYQEAMGLHLKPPLLGELERIMGSYISSLLERQRRAPAFLEELRSHRGP